MTLRISEVRQANPTWFSLKNKRFFGDIEYRILHSRDGEPYLTRKSYMFSDMFGGQRKAVWILNQINTDLTIGNRYGDVFLTLDDAKHWLHVGIVHKLDSVGCGIDNSGMTYPQEIGGGYDYDCAVHINDIEVGGDWMMALSKEDALVIEDIKSETDFRCTPKNNRRNIVVDDNNGMGFMESDLEYAERIAKIK